jgi:adenylate kinase family enzyme
MRKILVAGVSGSGKTTLASRLARQTGIPYIEMDGLHHGPNWQKRTSFEDDVAAFTAKESWIIEWQYRSVRPLLLARADTLIWLDLPYPVVLWQLVKRTVDRAVRQKELWNGNREPPLRTIFTNPDHIIRWSIRTRNKVRNAMPDIKQQYPGLRIIRIGSRKQLERWLGEC